MLKTRLKFTVRTLSFIISDVFFIISSLALTGYIFKALELGSPTFSVKTFLERMFFYSKEALVFLFLCILLNYIFGLYSSLWKYAGVTEIITLLFVLIVDFSILYIATRLLDIKIPLFTFPMSIILCFLAMTFTRMWYRLVLRSKHILFPGQAERAYKKVMVVGVGDAGAVIIRAMTHDPRKRGIPVVLVDDDKSKHKMNFLGIPVAGGRQDIPRLVNEYDVDRIVIAIPKINTIQLKELLDICINTGCEILRSDIAEMFNDSMKDSPNIYSTSQSDVPALRLEKIRPEDLLGREAVALNTESAEYIEGRTVLISGGAGSIGSEICRQICKLKPSLIVIYDVDENNSYSLNFEVSRKFPNQKIDLVIGSVRDLDKLGKTFEKYKPDVVFHAAAHKHVPLMENDPEEAIKNNIFGTYNIASTAIEYSVKKFILISTDKAVNPTNVMGASKRMCEYVIKGMNDYVKTSEKGYNTIFAAVRFGNVLGSNGSVIPLFKKQIAEGGPLTITDKRMTRYFMTIPEAAMLVIEAGHMAEGGEIFILDMGVPVKIDEMARNMIRLTGLIPDVDIAIEYIGLRPGEKLYEELSMDYENVEKTKQPKISVAKDDFMTHEKLLGRLAMLKEVLETNGDVRTVLKDVVPTYNFSK